MNYVFFGCRNARKKDFILEIDGQQIVCEENPSGIFANIKLEKGNHLLHMRKRTHYDTPLYYFNIINPLYIIWQLKFIHSEKLGYDENFSAIKIDFQSNGNQAERVELVYKKVNINTNGTYYTLSCERYSGIKKVIISKLSMDKTKIMRYKLTRILAVSFYMVIAFWLCLSSYIEGISSGTESLIFCLLVFLVCLTVIIRTIFEKSVEETRGTVSVKPK